MYKYIYTHIHTYIHTYRHIHIYICTYTLVTPSVEIVIWKMYFVTIPISSF